MIIWSELFIKTTYFRFIPKDVEKWFTGILTETIKYRKENNIVRNDYLDMMLSLKDKQGEYGKCKFELWLFFSLLFSRK